MNNDQVDRDDQDEEKAPGVPPNTVVIFKLSEDRLKAKKQAAKDRRDLLRDRLRDTKIAR